MDFNFVSKVTILTMGLLWVLNLVLRKVHGWVHESKLGNKRYSLPPGDFGLPIIGNMWSFLAAFKSSNPDSFLNSFFIRFGKTGIYKAFMFGSPSIIVTTPDTCRKVLNDDEHFKPGWPLSTTELIGRKSFIAIPFEEHKRLRKLTAAPINGHEALSNYIEYIEEISIATLDKLSKMGEIEFLTQLRKLTFRIIMYISLSSESEPILEALDKEYTTLNHGVRAMAINIPGFAYHSALKARKNLVAVFQATIDERRALKRDGVAIKAKRDMMDDLLEVEDENGRKLANEEITDLLIMYLNAGHESSAHTIMWATVLLQQNPEYLQKAKAEQEEIIKNRPAGQKGLTLKETRKMTYLSQVVDETLRWVTFSFVVFREAISVFKINGYTIPKGWKVLTWFRTCHLDPEVWPEPMKFNPSRWDDLAPKAGTFLPFGAGSRLGPGNDLAKLEISIFLHHFLLNYRCWKKVSRDRKMEFNFVSKLEIFTLELLWVLNMVLRKVHGWVHESKLGDKRYSLPPGDFGLPFIGNMRSFLAAFKSSNPDSFVNSFLARFGKTGIYKAFMFGSPSIIVTTPDICRKVLIDDEHFKPGWPMSTEELIEQEEIIKNRPAGEKGLTLKETRKMPYLSQVVDETLRWLTFTFVVFCEAISDCMINGYTIPKGWKVLIWFRTCHLDPKVWPEPMKFNSSRWDDVVPKVGTFLPFGAGSRLCPGNDLAKLEISIFLHFLLGYRLERTNPECPVQFLPQKRPKDACLARVKKYELLSFKFCTK